MRFDHLKRREFVTLLGSAAAWPLAGRARADVPIIGFLGPASFAGYASYLAGFRQGLMEAGYVEGRNVAIEYRWAENRNDRLPMLAEELVSRRVAVIATGGATAAVIAAKAATSRIPIVFVVGADPVKFGLVASLNRPGGNVTGVSFLSNMLLPKQLELLGELIPAAAMVAVLVNPNNPNAESDKKAIEAAAVSLGRRIDFVYAGNELDLDTAFARLVRRQPAGLLVFPDALFIDQREQLADLAGRHKLPAIYSNRVYAESGGLMSYGADQTDGFRQAGIYTGRILAGEKPSELPVMQSTKLELVVNLKTAKALGVDIPPIILARADEVLE
jgi:putative tryptophan/tyrosine transport system substrate-binding protein